MRALVWHGKEDIRCDTVPDPKIEHPRDAIVKITSTAICGSDLHLYDGFMMGMENGEIGGHRPIGGGGGTARRAAGSRWARSSRSGRRRRASSRSATASWCRSPYSAASASSA